MTVSTGWGCSVYIIDLASGAATLVGEMGGEFNSSGDCVFAGDGTLLMSSDHSSGEDILVRIDTDTAETEVIGGTGVDGIYGLAAAWGLVFGLNEDGGTYLLDTTTGHGTSVVAFDPITWYGAASVPTP